ncbi:MAG: hypothetical protein N2Z64_04790 [Dictyoglomus thermophilum]|uniref:hypothetical protein n=1 Tax=Dictyoglomus thermophilum TaxID=14 RepID=UPI001654401A|nr:hypothetical protein [Dictyoglomus thermophilum]MCX7720582.1 hypothetical protein [Dictyoglomus thermophilum]
MQFKYIAIIDKGRILALDTPMVLKSKVQDEIVYEIEVSYTSELDFHNIDGVKLLEKRVLDGKVYLKFSLIEENLISKVLNYITEKGKKDSIFEKERALFRRCFYKDRRGGE